MVDANVFTANQNALTDHDLAPYDRKCVAWSPDGTRVLAAGDDWDALFGEVARLGVTEYVTAFVELSVAAGGAVPEVADAARGDAA